MIHRSPIALDQIYGLLYHFEAQPSYLSPAGWDIFQKIESAIQVDDKAQVEKLIRVLLSLGGMPRGSQGFAEVYLVAGWSFYRIGDLDQAVRYLTDASAYYHAFDHQYMIVEWMLGLVLATRKKAGDELAAVQAWQTSLSTIEKILQRHSLPARVTKPYLAWKKEIFNILSDVVQRMI